MAVETVPDLTTDEVLDLIRVRARREIIGLISPEDQIREDNLASALALKPETPDNPAIIERSLYHIHLHKLEQHGVIKRVDEIVSSGPNFRRVRSAMNAVELVEQNVPVVGETEDDKR